MKLVRITALPTITVNPRYNESKKTLGPVRYIEDPLYRIYQVKKYIFSY